MPTENVRRLRVNRQLPCQLTHDELITAAKGVARATADLAAAETEMQAVKAEYKETVARLEARRGESARLVNEGVQVREVECEEIHDLTAKTVVVVRRDTGEQVENRAMSAQEREALPLESE